MPTPHRCVPGVWRRYRDHNCVTTQGFLCSESLPGSTSPSCSYRCITQLLSHCFFLGVCHRKLGWRNVFKRVCLLRTHSCQSEVSGSSPPSPLYNGGKQCNKAMKQLPKTKENADSWAELRFSAPSMLCQTEITTLPSNTELFNLTNIRKEQKHIHQEPGKYHCFSLVLQKGY